eukprot:GEMP01037099.1.p1 GENE.GEMP01037099.1~~GEMP01037099.1.p1  ORF type:complete len:143 (+),score=36.75 GEMP01037099.1:378-806(+)
MSSIGNRPTDHGMRNNPWRRMYEKKESAQNIPHIDNAQSTLERMYQEGIVKRLAQSGVALPEQGPSTAKSGCDAQAMCSSPEAEGHKKSKKDKKRKKKDRKVRKDKLKKKKKKDKKKKKKKKRKAESSDSDSDSSSSSSSSD